MKVLLTGASGLLGSHILEQGLKLGHQFKVISRSVSKRSFLFLNLDKVHLYSLDLSDLSSLPDDLLDGVDCIINCAALASVKAEDQSKMRAINLEAPKNLFEMATKEDIPYWVQVSSVSTLCSGVDDNIVDEKDIGNFRKTPYANLKYEFDCWIKKQNSSVRVFTPHPCYMLGRWDSRPSSGSILFAIKMRRFKTLLNAKKNFVAASDVARGIWQGIDSRVIGDYILGNENMSISSFYQLCCEKLNIDFSTFSFIDRQQFKQANFSENEKSFIEEFCVASSVSSNKAKQDFAYYPLTSVDQLLEETLDYFMDFKMLRVKK
ncbi:MAG: NAD(P)-dependent oxidoreductase [Bacteriovoracaceae bacterium]|nr:NAD(P)-dependent oxidoreductase [Bacteriovoracaceae bacterium]